MNHPTILSNSDGPQPVARPIGRVAAIDEASGRIVIRTDDGPELVVLFDGRTPFLRVAEGTMDLAHSTKISAAQVGVGDRVMARGPVAEDHRTISARSVYVKSIRA